MTITFKGTAKRLDDIDLTRLAHTIGCGEDVLHALIEVETRGTGFDKQDRVIMLFEPHKFYKHLRGDERDEAVRQNIAYKKWGARPYPKDSYPRLQAAIAINETAALLSASWGLPQLLGENFGDTKYSTVQEMVTAFAEDEENQLEAMVGFLKANRIDVALRKIEKITASGRKTTPADWVPVVKPYNGEAYAVHEYHVRANNAYLRWLKIKNTPAGEAVDIRKSAALEEQVNGLIPVESDVTADDNETAGTPPPAPAEEIKASQMSLTTRLTSLSIPTGVGAALLAIVNFAKSIPPLAWIGICLVAVAAMVIGYLIWKDSKKHAHERTLKVMDAAADKDKNNLRLI